jgi:hypothetical protein
MPEHGLTKSLWSDADFDGMGWHDARLHAFTALSDSFEFVMDLDYITKWVHPTPPKKNFKFWVSPATLVFRDVHRVTIEINMQTLEALEIIHVQRTLLVEKPPDWRWSFELSAGNLFLNSSGYTQYFRRTPVFQDFQQLELLDRGGISYERTTFDEQV